MRLILLGPPGAGKGTQSHDISDRLGIPQLSTGEILRRAVEAKSDIGNKAKAIMDSGGLVGDDIVNQIISDRIDETDCKDGFILDGYPRTLVQADAVEEMLKTRKVQLDSVIELAVDDDAMIERICGRYTCAGCGAGYHDTLNSTKIEGVCDKCEGTEFSRRDDDTKELVITRLQAYYKLTAPLTGYYHAKGYLRMVDGMDNVDVVGSNIGKILGK